MNNNLNQHIVQIYYDTTLNVFIIPKVKHIIFYHIQTTKLQVYPDFYY